MSRWVHFCSLWVSSVKILLPDPYVVDCASEFDIVMKMRWLYQFPWLISIVIIIIKRMFSPPFTAQVRRSVTDGLLCTNIIFILGGLYLSIYAKLTVLYIKVG